VAISSECRLQVLGLQSERKWRELAVSRPAGQRFRRHVIVKRPSGVLLTLE